MDVIVLFTKRKEVDKPIRISDFKFCANPVTKEDKSCVIVGLGWFNNSRN